MAERRMFAKTIIDSDAFLDMPLSTQALYFHLSMRADDEGFLNNPKKIQRSIGGSDDDMRLLIAKRFIIPFDSGVVVIKHWRIHNYIQKDRFKPTVYVEERAQLSIKDNNAYTLDNTGVSACLPDDESGMDTECIHDGYEMETQDRLGKDRLGKDNIHTDVDTECIQDGHIDEDAKFLDSIPSVTKKSTNSSELKSVLDSFEIDGELREAFIDFIKMRKEKKRPLTPRALKMVITRLDSLSKDKSVQIDMLNQSILHNWDTVYEVKDDFKKVGANGVRLTSKEDHSLDDIF